MIENMSSNRCMLALLLFTAASLAAANEEETPEKPNSPNGSMQPERQTIAFAIHGGAGTIPAAEGPRRQAAVDLRRVASALCPAR